MKELVISFDRSQLIKISDWMLDEVGDDESCEEAVRRAGIDENGGILDEKGRERLLLGITALSVLGDTENTELFELGRHKGINSVSVFRLDYSGEKMHFEFNFSG